MVLLQPSSPHSYLPLLQHTLRTPVTHREQSWGAIPCRARRNPSPFPHAPINATGGLFSLRPLLRVREEFRAALLLRTGGRGGPPQSNCSIPREGSQVAGREPQGSCQGWGSSLAACELVHQASTAQCVWLWVMCEQLQQRNHRNKPGSKCNGMVSPYPSGVLVGGMLGGWWSARSSFWVPHAVQGPKAMPQPLLLSQSTSRLLGGSWSS